MKQKEITVPYDSMPQLIRGSFLTKEQVEKLKEPFKDLVRVVRCMDCKHQHEYKTGSCPYYTTWGSVAPDDWYCADGERR